MTRVLSYTCGHLRVSARHSEAAFLAHLWVPQLLGHQHKSAKHPKRRTQNQTQNKIPLDRMNYISNSLKILLCKLRNALHVHYMLISRKRFLV